MASITHHAPSPPTSPLSVVSDISSLTSTRNLLVHEKIREFVTSIEDILCEPSYTHDLIMKIVEVSITEGYRFQEMQPVPRLSECANQIIRDQRNFPENSKMFHYYGIMINLFVKKSLEQINAQQQHIDMMETKAKKAIDDFRATCA